jgi:SAM-dependent methyltransferase
VITKIKPENASLLEIGCAHGWFLELAQQYFSVLGVEPDKNLVQQTLSKKLPVLQGYFPEAISDEKRFDIIVFNDVFEHIAGLPALTAACYKHLNDNGLLVINLPTTTGFFYRISKLLVKLKVPGYFERLWQKDSVSPHLHYFNHDNLVSLLKKRGFEIVTRKSLATIAYSGLKQRIFYYNQAGRFFNIIAFLGLLVMLPLIKKLPNDILLLVARKPQYLAASPEPLHDGQGWKTAKTALALDYSQDCK